MVEAYTVQYGRDGEPEAAIISAITPAGARALVRSRQPDVLADAVAHDILGWTADVSGADAIAFAQRAPAPLPDPPPPSVLVEDRGPVRIITLNRPHRRNAIDLATAQLLERVIDAFEADPAVTVAILTGAEGGFCAGMDLKAAAAGQFPITERRGPLGMTRMPIAKPVIAAVEGHALAGGCELALTADLIVAARDSSFGIPEPKRGLVAAAGGVLRLAQRLPRAIATELALTGEPMSAEKLAGFGLVNRLAEPGHALDVALELAAEIAGQRAAVAAGEQGDHRRGARLVAPRRRSSARPRSPARRSPPRTRRRACARSSRSASPCGRADEPVDRRHRDRLRRPRRRDRAQAARLRRHRRLREGRRRRRHLAREHLPGRGVRRPVAVLLLLVRAQPALAASLLAPAGDPRVHQQGRRRPRRPAPRAVRHRGHRRGLRRRRPARWTVALERLASPSWSTCSSPRSASSRGPSIPDLPGLDTFAGPAFHSATVGPRRRPRPASASR